MGINGGWFLALSERSDAEGAALADLGDEGVGLGVAGLGHLAGHRTDRIAVPSQRLCTFQRHQDPRMEPMPHLAHQSDWVLRALCRGQDPDDWVVAAKQD
jgi:hypothetical protein